LSNAAGIRPHRVRSAAVCFTFKDIDPVEEVYQLVAGGSFVSGDASLQR